MTRTIIDTIDPEHCEGHGSARCVSVVECRRRGRYGIFEVAHRCRQTGSPLSVSVNGRVLRDKGCPYGEIRDMQEAEAR